MKPIIKYLITAAAGFVVALTYFLIVGLFGAKDAVTVFHILSNGFFISGVLLLCLGGLFWAGGEGIYDGLTYSVYVVFGRFTRLTDKNWHPEHYGDYVVKKREKRQELRIRHLMYVGLAYVLLAAIALILYSVI